MCKVFETPNIRLFSYYLPEGGEWDNWWVYWVAPIAGALVAGLGYEYLYLRPLRPPVVGPPDSGVEEPRPGETSLEIAEIGELLGHAPEEQFRVAARAHE